MLTANIDIEEVKADKIDYKILDGYRVVVENEAYEDTTKGMTELELKHLKRRNILSEVKQIIGYSVSFIAF